MLVRTCVVVVALGAAGVAHAGVVETGLFRQDAARASAGSFSAPTVDPHNNTSTAFGPFNDLQHAQVTGAGAASANGSQNTTIDNGHYFGAIHADATAAGNPAGTSAATTSYGAFPNNFQTTFSVGFTVDEPTVAHFTGSAGATRTGSGGSTLVQVILGDVLNGTPQMATIFAQPAANTGTVSWDRLITLLPGHSYSFTATVDASQSNTFSGSGGSSAADVSFDVLIPSPGSAGLLALGLLAARRRR